MFGLLRWICGGLAFIAAVSPVYAQLRDLGVPANATWKHAATGLMLRSKLADLPRAELSDGSDRELDVIARYLDADTEISIYIFHPALMSVPMWFDRSETAIFTREVFANPIPVAAISAFTPPQAHNASALRRIYVPGGGRFKSTGLAMMPLGEWLVAIRISSTSLDAAQLDTRLTAAITAIGWPAGVIEAPAATPVSPCAKPLSYAKRARVLKPDMTTALVGALLAGTVKNEEGGKSSKNRAVIYCRDAPGIINYAVYRNADEQREKSYFMALGDAGRIIQVRPSLAATVNGGSGYAVSFGDLDSTAVYPDFDGFLSPEQAFTATKRLYPISRTSAGEAGGRAIVIDEDTK